eukprot:1158917-Amphidinium_carterae.1
MSPAQYFQKRSTSEPSWARYGDFHLLLYIAQEHLCSRSLNATLSLTLQPVHADGKPGRRVSTGGSFICSGLRRFKLCLKRLATQEIDVDTAVEICKCVRDRTVATL